MRGENKRNREGGVKRVVGGGITSGRTIENKQMPDSSPADPIVATITHLSFRLALPSPCFTVFLPLNSTFNFEYWNFAWLQKTPVPLPLVTTLVSITQWHYFLCCTIILRTHILHLIFCRLMNIDEVIWYMFHLLKYLSLPLICR